MKLTRDEIEFIDKDLQEKGIEMEGLRADLADHLMCIVEEHKKRGLDFCRSYNIAWHTLNGDMADNAIQSQTDAQLQDAKMIVRNLALFLGMLSVLIFVFVSIRKAPNAALILVCLSAGIFMVYHSIFYTRRNRSTQSRKVLFTALMTIPAGIVLLTSLSGIIPNTPGMVIWYVLIFLVAVPIYHRVGRTIMNGNSTSLNFMKQATEFIGIASFSWIALAASLTIVRPDVRVNFIPDLLVQGSCCILVSIGLGWLSGRKQFLRNVFQSYSHK